ncbi:carboxypeptidase-like regulatory domain-containing protein [Hymenobacter sp. NST-14]|uniref:carboxypeptidase regulatory-like domain-containing protein n=1 Tax=Hymenobacter piscis TaxID=2839984 RepID=UPI001C009519|nr:carboxypeptidase regulatory-like domain-containing protein [Hymenobacter piscis]MBT9394505.1 carboxypeptidase-like regulatory domain-containing protein [Hymenobacter piscis]
MHSALPLLALSLLGALVLPAPVTAQQAAPEAAPVDSLNPATSPDMLAVSVPGPAAAASQPAGRTLAGNVVDEWGNPLAGATVAVVGHQLHSVTTNANGDFLVSLGSSAPLLRVSFAGYEDAERVARGPADLLFKLDPIRDYRRDLKKRTKEARRQMQ